MQRLFPTNTFVEPKIVPGNRLVVAEAPGADEQIEGSPLVGGAGRVFDSLLTKAGIRRSDLSLINTIQCRPPENIYPTSDDARAYISPAEGARAVGQCYNSHLKPVIEGRKWARVDCLGSYALEAITGESGITANRGYILPVKGHPELGDIVVPTIHPAALMRDQLMTPVVISDLKKSLKQPPENYNVYPSIGDVRNFSAREFCFDIENNPVTGEVYMVGLTDRPYHAICVPFKGPYILELKRIFRNARVLIGHNVISHDIPHLQRAGVDISDDVEVYDTLLMNHLLFPQFSGDASEDKEEKARGKMTSGGHSLAFVASIFCSKKRWKHLVGDDKELYCCRDTDVTMQVFPQQKSLLKQFGLLDTYKLVSLPMGKLCDHLRTLGIKTDPEKVKVVRKRYLDEQERLELLLPESLRTQSVPVNKRVPAPPGSLGKSGKPLKFVLVQSSKQLTPWRSPKITDKWLHGDLKLPEQKHAKTKKKTTDKTALDRLVQILLKAGRTTEAEQLVSLKTLRANDETLTTFAKEKMVYGTSIHTKFNPAGTNSGRLSSADPNLQNVPDPARCIYIPHQPNWSIVQFDYSSIENRITAYLAGDSERLQRFNNPDFSEHKWAGEKFFGIPADQIKKSSDPNSPYSKAKHIVHGSNYGLGPRKMSMMYGVPEKEAKELQKQWKLAIPKTTEWQERTADEAKRVGYLVNPFGRRRWFYTSSVYTESLSFLPQSTAADVILRAMLALCYERIHWPRENVTILANCVWPLREKVNLLLTVHDSLVFEMPNTMVDEVVPQIQAVMEQKWDAMGGFSCPVAVEYGPSWGELQKYIPPSKEQHV